MKIKEFKILFKGFFKTICQNRLNIYTLLNKLYPDIRKILLSFFFSKQRNLLRRPYIENGLIKKILRNNNDYDQFRQYFYNNNIFPYSDPFKKVQIIDILKKQCTSQIESHINYAEDVLKNKFQIFELSYTFKDKINWHYSFYENYFWKSDYSEKINPRPKKNVDVKYVWELNRHQFLTYLGFAYYITGNERYSIGFKKIILDWIKNNPPLIGVNWFSGLEVSCRLVSWIFSLHFFQNSSEINNARFFSIIFKSMLQHAYFLKIFYHRRSFNHTIGSLFGTLLFSHSFNKIPIFKRWELKFSKKLSKQIKLQTRQDGSNIEQSVNYHRFVLEFFTLFMLINTQFISSEDKRLIEKMYEFLMFIIKPNKTFPKVGDFDDGKALMLTAYDENSYIQLLNLGAIIFQRDDFKYVSNRISAISVLLLGEQGFNIFDKLSSKSNSKNFQYFDNAGYIVIRSNWTNKANYLFVDFGRFGPQKAAHSHSDITNFIFSSQGKDVIIDSGTYQYNKSWSERNLFRSSKAHNILTIDNLNQAKITNWFSWEKKPRIKSKINISGEEIKLTCVHNGFNGFLVKRIIKTDISLNKLEIKDIITKSTDLIAEKVHHINSYFHFDNEIEIQEKYHELILNNEISFKVSSKYDFEMSLIKTEYSKQYGLKAENQTLRIHFNRSFEEERELGILYKIQLLK